MYQVLVGNAHLVAGGAEAVAPLLALLEDAGVRTRGNPDVYVREYARFGADDARELASRAALRAQGEARFFVIATPTMTAEAQNVLLKTLEEPPAGARFFIVVPSPEALLSTLRSRTQILRLTSEAAEGTLDTKTFLAATPEKRLDLLKPLLEKDEDDKRDLRPIISFLAGLEAHLAKHPLGHSSSGEAVGLRAVYRARKYATDKGALLKPLLEQVALLIPRQ